MDAIRMAYEVRASESSFHQKYGNFKSFVVEGLPPRSLQKLTLLCSRGGGGVIVASMARDKAPIRIGLLHMCFRCSHAEAFPVALSIGRSISFLSQ